MKEVIIKNVIVICFLFLSINCATLLNKPTQKIDVISNPPGAEVWVDGAKMIEITPTQLILERKNSYIVSIVKDGYKEKVITLEKEVSTLILFSRTWGQDINKLSGSGYVLIPDKLNVNLTQIGSLKEDIP